jgi:hypothetical protein
MSMLRVRGLPPAAGDSDSSTHPQFRIATSAHLYPRRHRRRHVSRITYPIDCKGSGRQGVASREFCRDFTRSSTSTTPSPSTSPLCGHDALRRRSRAGGNPASVIERHVLHAAPRVDPRLRGRDERYTSLVRCCHGAGPLHTPSQFLRHNLCAGVRHVSRITYLNDCKGSGRKVVGVPRFRRDFPRLRATSSVCGLAHARLHMRVPRPCVR